MNTALKTSLALAAASMVGHAAAQLTMYSAEGFRGNGYKTEKAVDRIEGQGYGDMIGSVYIESGNWELCDDTQFRGRCVALSPGRYPSLAATGLQNRVMSMRRLDAAPPASRTEVTLYDERNFGGQAMTTRSSLSGLRAQDFNDRAASIVVTGGSWEVCEHNDFGGRCVLLSPGRYPSIDRLGMADRISSLRPVGGSPADVPAAAPPMSVGEMRLYDRERFGGRTLTVREDMPSLRREDFNDMASSITVMAGTWEVCSDPRYAGRCVTLQPGQYPTLESMALNDRISSVRRVAGTPAPVPMVPSATFYEQEGFRGRSYAAHESNGNFDRAGLSVRAASIDVQVGRWDVCEDPRFGGKCVSLQPGRYPSIASLGLSDRVASARAFGADGKIVIGADGNGGEWGRGNGMGESNGRPPQGVFDPRRRDNEPLYEAQVKSVRQIVATSDQQRCYVNQDPVPASRDANVGAAIAGALLGGILGHQVGGGSGKDIATIGGVIAGAAIGSRVGGRMADGRAEDAAQRCTTTQAQGQPAYWDVTYDFRGIEHRVQMTTPPQQTIRVNAEGEPRL